MLTGKAKKDYQREYMAKRREKDVEDGPGRTNSVRPHPITQEMLDLLPAGVVRPTAQPTEATGKMSDAALARAVRGVGWSSKVAYAEVILRRYYG